MVSILAVHAHPDDIEPLAAGTLALLAEAGHEIAIATLTAGDCGSVSEGPEETARTRRGEATAAAAMIGASYHCPGLAGPGLFNGDPTRRVVTGLVRSLAPALRVHAPPAGALPVH